MIVSRGVMWSPAALGLALACAGVLLAGCGSSKPSIEAQYPTTLTTQPPAAIATPFRFFSESSPWNTRIAGDPVDPSSKLLVSALAKTVAEEERTKDGPWINTTEYSVPVYTVPASQRTVAVALVHHKAMPALSAAWSAVPLPANARPARGTDKSLVVWQPSTRKLWEFWRLGHEAEGGGWSAWWGGATEHVMKNTGVYGPSSWPGATKTWGLAATSLSVMGGLISLEDLTDGVINHAVSMSVPGVRKGVYVSPAERTDGGSTSPYALPEGARLRLDPTLALKPLHLSRVALMIAEAAKRFGIIVNNGASIVTFQAQDPVPTDTEPYEGPGGFFENKNPRQVLARFPWNQLEVLKMELHTIP